MMRRAAVVALALLVLGTSACRRSNREKADRHLEAGYALLLRAPEEAIQHFDRSTDQRGAKEYALGQAHEALGRLEEAQAHYQRGLDQRPGFIKAETALARVDFLQGRVEAATSRLRGAVAKAPAELPALLLYAVAASAAEDRTRASAALEAWPKRAQQSQPPAEYYLTRAALAREAARDAPLTEEADRAREARLHSVDGALVLAKLGIVGHKPWLARVLLARMVREKLRSSDATTVAALAIGLGEIELARTAASSIQPFPEDAPSQLVLGQLELTSGDPARATKHLKRSLQLLEPDQGPARAQAELLLAQAYLQQKDVERAAPLLAALATREPKNLAVQLLSAEADTARGSFDQALARLERLRAEHPKAPAVLESLVRTRLAAGNADGAVQAARERLAATPGDGPALRGLLDLLAKLDRDQEALREIEAQVQAQPTVEALWLLLAETTEKVGRPAELRAVLGRFTAQHPKSESAWLSLARLEERERHPEAVRRALDAALTATREPRAALLHLAELSMREHEWAEAAAAYERLLTIAPDDTNALNNLGYLYADRLDQPERAVSAAERAHHLAGARPIIEDTLGWALLRRGRAEDRARALALLQHASELLNHQDVRLHLAVALHVAGERKRAQDLLVGFRFRPDDPGHDFASAVLAAP